MPPDHSNPYAPPRSSETTGQPARRGLPAIEVLGIVALTLAGGALGFLCGVPATRLVAFATASIGFRPGLGPAIVFALVHVATWTLAGVVGGFRLGLWLAPSRREPADDRSMLLSGERGPDGPTHTHELDHR